MKDSNTHTRARACVYNFRWENAYALPTTWLYTHLS